MTPRTTLALLTTSSIAIVGLFIVTAFVIQRPPTDEFKDVDAIRGFLAGEQVYCSDMRVLDAQQPEITSYGGCKLEGEQVEMYVFIGEAERDSWADAITDIGNFKVLVGGNWVIVSPSRAALESIREILGGILR